MTILLIVLIVVALWMSLCLCLLLGLRGSDFLYLAALLLPTLWLSRLDSHHLSPGGLPFYLLWGLLGVSSLVLLCFANPNTRRLLAPSSRSLFAVTALLLTLMALSTLANHERSIDLLRGFHACCFIAIPSLAAWTVVCCCRIDHARALHLVGGLCLVGTFVSLLSILTATIPGLFSPLVTTYKTTLESGRAFSPLGGPSATAMCLLLVYCVAGGTLLSGRSRFGAMLVLVLCFLALLTTLARAALVSFVIANLYLWCDYRRGLRRPALRFMLVAAVLLTSSAYGLAHIHSLERLSSGLLDDSRSASLNLRFQSFTTATEYGMNHMLVGGGWGLVYTLPREYTMHGPTPPIMYIDGKPTAPKPHNLFALVFAESGVLAVLTLLCLFWLVFRSLRPPDPHAAPEGYMLVRGFRAGFLGFAVMCVAQDHLFLTTKLAFFFYLFVFLGLALSAHFRTLPILAGGTTPEVARGEPGLNRVAGLSSYSV